MTKDVFLAVHQPSLDTGKIVGYNVYTQEKDVKRQEIRRDTCKFMLNQEGKAFQDTYILWRAKGAETADRFLVECVPQFPRDSVWGVLVKAGERQGQNARGQEVGKLEWIPLRVGSHPRIAVGQGYGNGSELGSKEASDIT